MTILDDILVRTRETIDRDRHAIPSNELEAAVKDAPSTRDFVGALAATSTSRPTQIQLIAEVKRASPSAGLIREDFDAATLATQYQSGGAACISVLTDEPFFQGSLDFLRQVRSAVDLPLLRKDFIVDRYQLLQARDAGADCVLLIAECLSQTQMQELHDQAIELGMATLIELFDPENLKAVVATGTRLVGINNRDLRTFETTIQHTVDLCPRIPEDRLVVGESGIQTHEDLLRLENAGVKAVLVGESLMRRDNVEEATARLLGLSSV